MKIKIATIFIILTLLTFFSLLYFLKIKNTTIEHKQIENLSNVKNEKIDYFSSCKNAIYSDCIKVLVSDPNSEISYKIACENGINYGCVLYGNKLKEAGKIDEAFSFFDKACLAGDDFGCKIINEKKIKECSKGLKKSCEAVKKYFDNLKEINVVDSLFWEYPTELTLNKLKESDGKFIELAYNNYSFSQVSENLDTDQLTLVVRYLLFLSSYADGASAEDRYSFVIELLLFKPIPVLKALSIEENKMLEMIPTESGILETDVEPEDACISSVNEYFLKIIGILDAVNVSFLKNGERNILLKLKQSFSSALKNRIIDCKR